VRRDDRADDADRGELGLVEEHAERRAVVAVGRDHRRRQDHDEADDDEDHGRAEQHVVGRDRRLQAREERQRPVQQAEPWARRRALEPLDRLTDRDGGRVAVLVIDAALGPAAYRRLEGVAASAVVGEHVHRRRRGREQDDVTGSASSAARATTSSITSTPAIRHSLRRTDVDDRDVGRVSGQRLGDPHPVGSDEDRLRAAAAAPR
jgi:hypothetical protein